MKQQQPPKPVKRVMLRLEPALYDELVELARREKRSLHRQVVWMLEKTLQRPAEE